jgi:hypothetical protein
MYRPDHVKVVTTPADPTFFPLDFFFFLERSDAKKIMIITRRARGSQKHILFSDPPYGRPPNRG